MRSINLRQIFISIIILLGLLTPLLCSATTNVDWAASFGSIGQGDEIDGSAVDAANNAYITGGFSGTLTLGGVNLTALGGRDAFVAKLNSSGNVLWAKNFGGSGAGTGGNSIRVDALGNVYLGGYFNGANLTTPVLTSIGNEDSFVVKLDSSGNTIWAKNFGGSGAIMNAPSLALDSSGNVYLGGYFNGANLTMPILTEIGTEDAFVVKLDSSGNTIWSKNFGGSGAYTYGSSIAVDGSGNPYLSGFFESANLTIPALTLISGASGHDAFAIKLDSSGNTIWSKNFGGSGAYTYGNSITVDSSNNVYLGGGVSGGNLTTPPLTLIGGSAAFAFKLDSSGNIIWSKGFGGSGATVDGMGIVVDGYGNAYLSGWFSGASLATPVLANIGLEDALAIKLDSSGNVVWANNYGGSGANADATGIALDGSGNLYLSGFFDSGNLTTPALTNFGPRNAFILKTVIPAVSVSPTNLIFPSVGIGTAVMGAWNVTVTNNGLSSLVISSVTSSNSDFGIAQNNCGTISAGGNCVISFGYGPTSIGLITGTLTIVSNDAGSPHTISMTGTGIQGSQIIGAISLSPTLSYHGTSTVSATATSGLAVTFSSTTPNVCTVIGNIVTDIGIGSCIIAADQAGNTNYAAAPEVTKSIVVKFPLVIGGITFSPATLAVNGTTTAIPSTNAIASAPAIVLTSSTPSVCLVSGFTVLGLASGTCTVAANQAGDAYNIAATQITQSITVNAATQTQTIGAITFSPAILAVGSATTVSATASSGLEVTFSSTTPSVCSISGITVTGVTAGTCIIAAGQAGNANYSAAPQVIQNITVGIGAQTRTLGDIYTVAGNGAAGYSGDNGAATLAELTQPCRVTVDAAGNIYIADYLSNVIRKVTTSTGIITTVAGNGTSGYSGDNGSAAQSELSWPFGIAVDGTGNLYIADWGNNRVRKVTASTGIITTVAGNGTAGYSGDNGSATLAELNGPSDIAFDAAGNLIISDRSNNRIRKVTVSTGIITTVAGNGTAGYSGDNGSASLAELNGPAGITLDSTGNMYIAESYNNRIRKVIASTGIITTVAGNGTAGYSGDNAPATLAGIISPYSVELDGAGNLYIADTGGDRVRKVAMSSGIITTVVGNGTPGYSGDNGLATLAELNGPSSIVFDSAGNLYINDQGNSVIRMVYNGQLSQASLSFVGGWNLVGNSVSAPLSVAGTFGTAANVSTVWKWETTGTNANINYPAWAFYTPSLGDGGAAYAATKGYDFLTTINAGEGFWVNAKSAFTTSLPTGSVITTSNFQAQTDPTQDKLISGWNLIATGDNVTPSAFNSGLSLTPPSAGVIPLNVTTLWAWNGVSANWYFYSPSLDANNTLATYITNKNYLNFGTNTLTPTTGFWVNKP